MDRNGILSQRQFFSLSRTSHPKQLDQSPPDRLDLNTNYCLFAPADWQDSCGKRNLQNQNKNKHKSMTTKRIAFEKCAFIEFAFVKTMNSGVYKSDLICIRCIGNVHNKEWIARRRRRQKRLLLCNLERKQNITRLYWHLCELCSLLFPYESSLSRTRH